MLSWPYGKWASGWTFAEGERKHYKVHIAVTLTKRAIPIDRLEYLAALCIIKRKILQPVYDGVAQHARQYHDEAVERRARYI